MDELIKRLQERAGLSEEQARQAATVVADFMQEHLSGDQLQQIAGQIPGLGRFAGNLPDNAGEQLGGFLRRFGGQKQE